MNAGSPGIIQPLSAFLSSRYLSRILIASLHIVSRECPSKSLASEASRCWFLFYLTPFQHTSFTLHLSLSRYLPEFHCFASWLLNSSKLPTAISFTHFLWVHRFDPMRLLVPMSSRLAVGGGSILPLIKFIQRFDPFSTRIFGRLIHRPICWASWDINIYLIFPKLYLLPQTARFYLQILPKTFMAG